MEYQSFTKTNCGLKKDMILVVNLDTRVKCVIQVFQSNVIFVFFKPIFIKFGKFPMKITRQKQQ